MNVLPLVSAFLLIFAICSYAFVHNVRTAVEEEIHFTASHRISRKFESNCVSHAYKKLAVTKSNSPARTMKKKEPIEGTYTSPRDAFNKRLDSKLNLRPLTQNSNHEKLEEIALDAIERLYFLAPFYTKGLGKEILDTLVATLKQCPDSIRFDQLLAKMPAEKSPPFYKLVKGTHSYKLGTPKGYPSLADFFSIENLADNEPPAHFDACSRPLLEAILGPMLTVQIINEEKHKWEKDGKHAPLTKQEFEAILLSDRHNPSEFERLLSFGTKKQALSFDIIHDIQTGLQIKLEK